jgi:hypothetical protein
MAGDLNHLAHTTERIGLAMAGLACGVFVAASVSHANLAAMQSLWTTILIIVAGGIGFFAGVELPPDRDGRFGIGFVCMLCGVGTVLAAVAALVAVGLIVFDVEAATAWLVGLFLVWMTGTILQIAAATIARHRHHPTLRRWAPALFGGPAAARPLSSTKLG